MKTETSKETAIAGSTADAPIAYEPKASEIAAAKRMIARRAKEPPKPRYTVSYTNGKATIDPDHPDTTCTHVLLADLLATGDSTLAEGLLVQLANVAQAGDQLTTAELNLMVATVGAIAPRDPTEALIACQMAAIHGAMMRTVRRLNRADMLPQMESTGNQANKLARTFAAQLEALKRYRSTGEQRIRVQHVTVNEGGQAIVGNVNTGGGGNPKNASQSHAPSESGPDERSPALLGQEQALKVPLPSTSREGPEGVPHARRASGCPEGRG